MPIRNRPVRARDERLQKENKCRIIKTEKQTSFVKHRVNKYKFNEADVSFSIVYKLVQLRTY